VLCRVPPIPGDLQQALPVVDAMVYLNNKKHDVDESSPRLFSISEPRALLFPFLESAVVKMSGSASDVMAKAIPSDC
jgi:hypothetical protein